MTKIFVSQNLSEVELFKDVLEQAGIPCMIKNQHTAGLAGEVPFAEVFPELWVERDGDYSIAEDILNDMSKGKTKGGTAWTCPKCGEKHTKEFSTCWNCGSDRKKEP